MVARLGAAHREKRCDAPSGWFGHPVAKARRLLHFVGAISLGWAEAPGLWAVGLTSAQRAWLQLIMWKSGVRSLNLYKLSPAIEDTALKVRGPGS